MPLKDHGNPYILNPMFPPKALVSSLSTSRCQTGPWDKGLGTNPSVLQMEDRIGIQELRDGVGEQVV